MGAHNSVYTLEEVMDTYAKNFWGYFY
jgi:hypothetical protein